MTRMLPTLAVLLLLTPLRSLAQCPELDPLDDGSGAFGAIGLPALVISEINPGDYIEFFNTTLAPIAMSTSPYWLCSPFVYVSLPGAGAAVVVPAGGYATIPWPASFTDTDAGGEIQLYKTSNFGVSTDILDFVCWGVNPHGTRVAQAIAIGKWSGGCAPVLASGAIHRKIGVKGTTAADYDVASAPSPMNCTPAPTGIGATPPLGSARIWNSPNPFTTDTQVEFMLDTSAQVEVAIYSVDGSLVRVLSKQSFPAGRNRVAWNGTDQSGRSVASGTYLARLSGGSVSATARVTLVR